MGEAAVMGEAKHRTFEVSQDVDVRSFRCQRHRGCGQRGLAIESGAAQTGASQEVSDWFQRVIVARTP